MLGQFGLSSQQLTGRESGVDLLGLGIRQPHQDGINSPDNEGIECIEVVDEIHPKQGTLLF
jgi:hypothetical protein